MGSAKEADMSAPTHSVPVNRYSRAVWRRNATVWRKLIGPSLTTNVLDPLIFLFAFGYGLGAVIDRIGGLSYLSFVVPGMMCYAAMFAASFEATISVYARFGFQKTWDAILATPVTLTELMMGEMSWAASKGLFASACVIVVGWIWGGIGSSWGALAAVPVVALGAVCFACTGLVVTSHAKYWDIFSYFFTFWVTPMFMFSGTFFEVTRFPWFVQAFAWILPMTHLIAVVRPLTAGLPLDWLPAAGHIAYMAALALVAFLYARRRFGARLFG
jgi:lipooligosaccharide transport system permease protein